MDLYCKFFAATYVCGLFFNASLIVIVLLSWPMDMLPFWFRLLFAVAPLFFLAAGYFLRKAFDGFAPKKAFLWTLLLCGVLLIPGVGLAAAAPESVFCWFLFPVSGDLAAAFGDISVWHPVYSILGAVGAPLLFYLGTLLRPLIHPEETDPAARPS